MSSGPISIRDAVLPDDEAGIRSIDTGFATDTIFKAEVTITGVTVTHEVLETPLAKAFPLDDLGATQEGDLALVAEAGGRIVAFAAAEFHSWNRRLAITHIYIQPSWRGKGVGRALVDRISAHGRRLSAAEVWVEASNINTPALAVYERLGFTLSGVDLTLYEGTDAKGEFAFFLSKPVSH
jgi:ribosomal protein S18 acetylase RimI-like enzyme